jgi:hypothetical protein
MSDIGNDFKAWNKVKKQKKVDNIRSSTELLKARGFDFNIMNGGTHLIIQHNGETADFWPSTGKYNIRGSSSYNRGVYNLISDLIKDSE